MTWVVWPIFDRSLEDNSLIVAFALAFRLDAIAASWPLFSTLDTTLPTGEAAGLGSLPHFGVC
jgi:hypothetical protein